MLSNAYFLAKFRFDTAENEPAKNLQNFATSCSLQQARAWRAAARGEVRGVAVQDHGRRGERVRPRPGLA